MFSTDGLCGLFEEEEGARIKKKHIYKDKKVKTRKVCLICGTSFLTARDDKVLCSFDCSIERAVQMARKRGDTRRLRNGKVD